MKISNKFDLGRFMTFESSKVKPIHAWFWYKEGYAPELVEFCVSSFESRSKSKVSTVLDPFCGVGTTLLAAKTKKIQSIGVDASSLAVFISKTKTDDYSDEDLSQAREFIARKFEPKESTAKDWEFELFPARAAFPKRNFNEILALREAIEQEEGRAANLLMLALLSILPQSSIVLKDGGVLKIDKRKQAMPAKEIFRRKVKQIIADLESKSPPAPTGYVPQLFLGDARALDIASESVDMVITSPPYLNNIDYSKIYGLELSLLARSKQEAELMRLRAIRSFIGKDVNMTIQSGTMPIEVGEIGDRIPIIGTYFKDMEGSIKEMHRTLRPGGAAYVNVSNSVIHETHVLVDEVFGEMAERIGFSDVEILVGAERIADVRPAKVKTRESMVVMRK